MYIKRVYSIKAMLLWTRRNIFVFFLLALIPVLLYDIFDVKWLHVPWLPLSVLGTAISFLVSFKNNASYDRLWEARKIWGGIVNASRSWTIMVKDYITNEFATTKLPKKELYAIHRELVHRHVAWLTALRYQLRKNKLWESHLKTGKSNREYRKEMVYVHENDIPIENAIKQYLSEDEYQSIFSKGNQASQLLGIQSRRLRELKEEGYLDDFRHMEMGNMLVEFYTLQGKSERIKNFPYPRQYASMNYMFVWLFIILLPFGIMEGFEGIGDHIQVELQKHLNQDGLAHKVQSFLAEHFVWFSIPFSVIVAWVFHTMELIGENSENPFEGGPNDVPITNMSRGIEIDIRQLIDDTDIPEPYVWKNDVVM